MLIGVKALKIQPERPVRTEITVFTEQENGKDKLRTKRFPRTRDLTNIAMENLPFPSRP